MRKGILYGLQGDTAYTQTCMYGRLAIVALSVRPPGVNELCVCVQENGLSSSHLHLPFLYFLIRFFSFVFPLRLLSSRSHIFPFLFPLFPGSPLYQLYSMTPSPLPTYFTTLYPRLDPPIDIHPTHSSSYFSSFVPLFLHISPSASPHPGEVTAIPPFTWRACKAHHQTKSPNFCLFAKKKRRETKEERKRRTE